MAKCAEKVAPLFVTESVADVRDILVFGEDMTNEDEEKQAIAELERLKQERRERKRKQREDKFLFAALCLPCQGEAAQPRSG